MNSITTRYYGSKRCDLVEKQLGFRITDAKIEKRKGEPVKVLAVSISRKNQ